MAILPIPYKCIWCQKGSPKVTFTSVSHVLPECVGNDRQQVLPKGIVCDKCNNYFGSKVEPALISDPIFKTVVGILQLRDKRKSFIFECVQSGGVHRIANMKTNITHNKITIKTEYIIKGQLEEEAEIRNIIESKNYEKKELALFSRAIHKIAFESLAYSLFVKDDCKVDNLASMRDVNIFDRSFDTVRQWVRYGKPIGEVRPVLRYFNFGQGNNLEELSNWEYQLYNYKKLVFVEMHLYGDWYFLSLTSTPNKASDDLINLTKHEISKRPLFILGNKLQDVK